MHKSPLVTFSFAVLTPLLSLPAQEIQWSQDDLSGALAASKDSVAKMVMIYYFAKEHDLCSAMYSGTILDAKVVPVLNGFVCLGAESGTDAGTPLFRTYGVQQVPTVLFVQPDGEVADLVQGYVSVADFLARVERIKKGEGTIAGLRKAVAADPTDFESHMRLVNKLNALGKRDAALEVVEAMIAKDPKARNEHVAEAMLLKISSEIFKPGVSSLDYDLAPLRKFLSGQRHKRVKFLGYDQMARVEYSRDNLKEAAKHAQTAWKNVPDDQVLEFGQRMASIAFKKRKELEKLNPKFLKLALKISEKALDEVEKECKKTPDKPWLAGALYLHAAVLIANNKRKDAFAAMDRAIELDPNAKYLKDQKARWVAGDS